jgi:NAD(P)-dependent dehydrogenase (short-subunit alcohol dehydrogenase family)
MKIAVVTGGGQGIGKGITQALLTQGWRVAVLDQDAEAVRDFSDEMPTDKLIAIRADVSSERDVEKAFDKITAWTNAAEEVEGIDLLVSNAASPVQSVVRSKNWSLRNGRRGKTAM